MHVQGCNRIGAPVPPRIRERAAHVTGRPPRTTTDLERHRASGRRHGSEDTRGRTGLHYRPGTVCAEFSQISPTMFSKNTGGSGRRILYKLDMRNCLAHASALWASGTSCAEFGSKSPSAIFSYMGITMAPRTHSCSQKIPKCASAQLRFPAHVYGNGRPRLRSLPPLTPLPGTHAGSGVRDELVTKKPVRLSHIIVISIRTVNKERPGYEPRLPELGFATIGVRQTQSSLASPHV